MVSLESLMDLLFLALVWEKMLKREKTVNF